jgi:hypothetical protein
MTSISTCGAAARQGFLHITTHVYYRRSVVEAWIADQEHQQGGGHRG